MLMGTGGILTPRLQGFTAFVTEWFAAAHLPVAD